MNRSFVFFFFYFYPCLWHIMFFDCAQLHSVHDESSLTVTKSCSIFAHFVRRHKFFRRNACKLKSKLSFFMNSIALYIICHIYGDDVQVWTSAGSIVVQHLLVYLVEEFGILLLVMLSSDWLLNKVGYICMAVVVDDFNFAGFSVSLELSGFYVGRDENRQILIVRSSMKFKF